MNLLEQISFEARDSEYIDAKSGVSARMSITAYENLISTAEYRQLVLGLEKTSVRMSDFMGIIPAITGKVELVYEGEQEGAAFVAQKLVSEAVRTLFDENFPKIEKLKHSDAISPYDEIIGFFRDGNDFLLATDINDAQYSTALKKVRPLEPLILKFQPQTAKEDLPFLMEFVLWGLAEYSKLSKGKMETGFEFKDLFDTYLKGAIGGE